MASPSNLLASPVATQQMLLNQVMNRNPQAQALAQVMAQSMAQGIRVPFANPYASTNLQQLLASGNSLNGLAGTSNSNSGGGGSGSSNSNNGNNANSNSNNGNSNGNSNNNNNLSNGEQQVAASSNRAKFLQRLNPLNLFRRLRTRNQKNNKDKNNKDQSNNNNNSNEINNSIPDLEDRSQFFLPADLLLGSASTTNQQQLSQLTIQQQQLAEQLYQQLAQLNMQLAQQSNNKAKFLRKMGSSSNNNNLVFTSLPSSSSAVSTAHSTTNAIKKVAKRDVANQLNNSSSSQSIEEQIKKETISYSLDDDLVDLVAPQPQPRTISNVNGTNSTHNNDTETAENGFFPVADLYQNYKFNIRPRFRFPSTREQRRISNTHGLHVNTNNFLTSGSMKSNFVGLMGSRNYEVISGGILNNEGHRNTEPSMQNGMHSNNAHNQNHKLPHHQNQARNLGHMLPNKGNKFNIDNDFDDEDEDDDSDSGYNGQMMGKLIY